MKSRFIFLLTPVLFLYSCKKCTIDPDLITDLLAPTTNIFLGESVDWTLVIKSEKDISDCKILDAAPSVSSIVVEYFKNQNDSISDTILIKNLQIGKLCVGEELQTDVNITFDSSGIYLISAVADIYNSVVERNEINNKKNLEMTKTTAVPLLKNTSVEFLNKLENCSAIVIVEN
jgi:hypothetical protein